MPVTQSFILEVSTFCNKSLLALAGFVWPEISIGVYRDFLAKLDGVHATVMMHDNVRSTESWM